MLVATFGDTTGWAGKTIAFEGDQFILDGHGPITSGAVVQYDQQGYLAWSSSGLRQWVYEQAATQAPSSPPQEASPQVVTSPELPDAAAAGHTKVATVPNAAKPPEGPVLVATFGEQTTRVGKTIVHDRGAFVVEGEAPRTAAEVMELDREQQLVWVDEGTRAWVGAKAAGPRPEKPADGWGTLGFVLVIAGFFLPLVGIIGWIMCYRALMRARRYSTPPGLAWWGVWVGLVGLVISLIWLIAALSTMA